MTRGLYPPDTLSKDDVNTLRTVRRDIYYNSMIGGGFGLGSGLVLHTGAQWARKMGFLSAKLNRNTLMLSMLGGGAFGMFLFAVSTGKERVHTLHPIFQVGAIPPGDLDHQNYMSKVNKFQRESSNELNIEDLQKARVTRRKTMADSFERSGISDSHGGAWYKEDGLDIQRMHQTRMTRRRTMAESFERGDRHES